MDLIKTGWMPMALVAGALLATLASPAPAQCQLAKLRPADGGVNQLFGRCVGISGDVLLIGAPGDSQVARGAGAAYLYRQAAGHWVRESKLTARDGARDDVFGRSVAIHATAALIGAPFDDDHGMRSGSAYVFERDAVGWLQGVKLTAADAQELDNFGWSVALDGDVAVIGAPQEDEAGGASGAAYVFERIGGAWVQTAKLMASDAYFGEEFGTSVAVSGDVIVIGAPNDDDLGIWSGSAYVFERIGGVWSQTAKLVASDGSVFHSFGESVGVTGPVVLIGALHADGREYMSGAAYVFEPDQAGVWTECGKIFAADGVTSHGFGHALHMDGAHAVIAAPWDPGRNGSGASYVFQRDAAGAWSQIGKLIPQDGAYNDRFGYSVGLSGDHAVIGAPFDDDLGADSGSAYVFAVNPEICECLAADLDGDGVVALGDLGILLADFGCQPPGPCPGDIDHDGDTDLADLGILLARFGEVCR